MDLLTSPTIYVLLLFAAGIFFLWNWFRSRTVFKRDSWEMNNISKLSPPDREPRFRRNLLLAEIALLLIIAILYSKTLLDSDPESLQQTGEHNPSVTLAILADIFMII